MPENALPQIQTLANAGKILWTEHVAIRLRERGLRRADVIACIENGEVIEQYPDDTPYPSCLIFGICRMGKPLHIVAGLNEDILCCIVTAYRPDTTKWESDNKTRKAGQIK